MQSRRNPSGGIFIEVLVTPNSKKESFEYAEGKLRLRVKEPADRGKANRTALKLASETLGECELVSGFTSKKKVFWAKKQTPQTLNTLLESLQKQK